MARTEVGSRRSLRGQISSAVGLCSLALGYPVLAQCMIFIETARLVAAKRVTLGVQTPS